VAFKAPYFSKDELRLRAADFLARHNPRGSIPVPIDYIIERDFDMDIVPMPGLQDNFDVVAFITRDLREIRVDEYVYLHRVARYRFSIAHELAHRILHPELWQAIEFHDIRGWKKAIAESIPEREYGFVEFHANFFAGLVLVPAADLESQLRACLNTATAQGIDPSDEATGARDLIEGYLGRAFEVSRDVIHRRVDADGLWPSA
jgi:hypothetical protein